MENITIINICDRPEIIEKAACWFSSKWGIPEEKYLTSMKLSVRQRNENKKSIQNLALNSTPQWYVILDEDARIIAGAGIIDNDFHERKDLAPNLCALYVEERWRNRGIARKLLDFARSEMAKNGIERLYLVTDHTDFYEKCGWRFVTMVRGDDGIPERMYEADCTVGEITISGERGDNDRNRSVPGSNELEYEIRRMEEKDLDSVMVIWLETNKQAHQFIAETYWENNFEQVKEILPQAEVYVAERKGLLEESDDSLLAGFIGMDENYVEGIFVRKDCQSHGIGKGLLDYAKGIKPELSLNVYEKNNRAVQFYEREGFEICEKTVDEATGQAEYLMRWSKK